MGGCSHPPIVCWLAALFAGLQAGTNFHGFLLSWIIAVAFRSTTSRKPFLNPLFKKDYADQASGGRKFLEKLLGYGSPAKTKAAQNNGCSGRVSVPAREGTRTRPARRAAIKFN